MLVNLDKLKKAHPALYGTVARTLGYTSGNHEVDIANFTNAAQRKLNECAEQPTTTAPPPAAQAGKGASMIDFDALKSDERFLHTLLSRAVGFETGQHEVDLTVINIAPQYRFRLAQWVVLHPAAEPVVDKPAPPPRDYAAEDRAALKKDIDQSRAISRLKEWEAVGLEDTEANANFIRDFVNNSAVKGYWSQEIVDAAIANLGPKGTNQLTWKPKELPAPPPPPEPTEVLEPWQLRIDATEDEQKQASVRALKDLVTRRRIASTGLYIRPRGRFGSSIF